VTVLHRRANAAPLAFPLLPTRSRLESSVSALKFTLRTVLDLVLIVALGAAIYIPAQYFNYRKAIPDAATPNGGHIALWRSAEALGFRVPALHEQENWSTVIQAFRTNPAQFPDSDEALLDWLRAQPDVRGPRAERQTRKEERTVIVHYRFPRRVERLKVPWEELGYGKGTGARATVGLSFGLTLLQESPAQLRGKMALSLLPGVLLVGGWRTRRWWWKLIEWDRARGGGWPWWTFALAGGCYGVSFFLPAADVPFLTRLRGGAAFDAALKHGRLSWYANPLFWLALILLLLRRRFLASVAALAALGVGLSEANRPESVHNKYLAGYWLWLCSMAIFAGGSFGGWCRLGRPTQLDPPKVDDPGEEGGV
jgi:hypothetical protein